MSRALATGGILRFPRFCQLVIQVMRNEQAHRIYSAEPTLLGSYIRFSDVSTGVVLAVVLLVFRITLQTKILPRIFGSRSQKLVSKLTEDLFYAFYYVAAFTYFQFVVLGNSTWSFNLLSNGSKVVQDLLHPFPPPLNEFERWYYIQASGFYLSATVFLLAFDSRRSDFSQLIIHHIVTIGMIAMSYLYGYVRVGMVVLGLHDLGDIFLYSSKFLHHMGVKHIDVALFAIFAITFYFTRLVMYSRIVHAVTVETLQTLVQDPSFNQWAIFYDTYLPHYFFFVFALLTLLILQCFWFTLILRLIGAELFFGKKISDQGDIRSEDGDEEERPQDIDEILGDDHPNIKKPK